MKLIVCVGALFFASLAMADSDTERTAIESVIATLNAHLKPASALFSADVADSAELARLADLDRMLSASEGPLPEVTPSRLVVHSIRFITADVAMVDAANTQYGSLILKRTVPILLVMKKEGADWRIASVRIIVELAGFAPYRSR